MSAHQPFQLPIDAQRALQARAFIVLFETLLIGDQAETKASLIVTTIDTCGLGKLEVINELTRLTIFGIRADTRHSMTDLLRQWQTAALDRLAPGARL